MRCWDTLKAERSGLMLPKAKVMAMKDSLSLRARGPTSNFSAVCQSAYKPDSLRISDLRPMLFRQDACGQGMPRAKRPFSVEHLQTPEVLVDPWEPKTRQIFQA